MCSDVRAGGVLHVGPCRQFETVQPMCSAIHVNVIHTAVLARTVHDSVKQVR